MSDVADSTRVGQLWLAWLKAKEKRQRAYTQRAYTLDEIDRLRDATRTWYGLNSNFDTRELEERVRTFMFAGLDPATLEASVRARRQRTGIQ